VQTSLVCLDQAQPFLVGLLAVGSDCGPFALVLIYLPTLRYPTYLHCGDGRLFTSTLNRYTPSNETKDMIYRRSGT
jgi:hypothetical protein